MRKGSLLTSADFRECKDEAQSIQVVQSFIDLYIVEKLYFVQMLLFYQCLDLKMELKGFQSGKTRLFYFSGDFFNMETLIDRVFIHIYGEKHVDKIVNKWIITFFMSCLYVHSWCS